MISCNLTKPESTFDQVRKAYADLKPIDVCLVATAIVECGHFAKVVHDGTEYSWPGDQGSLAKALAGDVLAASGAEETPKAKKVSKAKAKLIEETILRLSIPIVANQQAGEAILGKRKDLKTLLGDILKEGVEYLMSHQPVGTVPAEKEHYFYGQYYAAMGIYQAQSAGEWGRAAWNKWYPAITKELMDIVGGAAPLSIQLVGR